MLAIETSQRSGSVALRLADGSIQEEPLHQGDRHSDDLMPAIDRLTRRWEVTPAGIHIVVVSCGPGGFSGLRIAITSAKMIAEVTGARVISVPSALVAAYGCDDPAAPELAVALACKRDTCWLTRCRADAEVGRWQIEGTPGMITADAFDPAGLPLLLADEHLPAGITESCSRSGVAVRAFSMSATACCRAANHLAESGCFVDPLGLAPLYAREPEAVRLWQQR